MSVVVGTSGGVAACIFSDSKFGSAFAEFRSGGVQNFFRHHARAPESATAGSPWKFFRTDGRPRQAGVETHHRHSVMRDTFAQKISTDRYFGSAQFRQQAYSARHVITDVPGGPDRPHHASHWRRRTTRTITPRAGLPDLRAAADDLRLHGDSAGNLRLHTLRGNADRSR